MLIQIGPCLNYVMTWALVNRFYIERPLRDWEIVTQVLSCWDAASVNAIVMKKYPYRNTISPKVIQAKLVY